MIHTVAEVDRAADVQHVEMSFSDVVSVLAKPLPPGTPKDHASLVWGARFDPPHRLNKNCTKRSIVAIDVDDGLSFDQAVERLQRLELHGAVHTTASHTPTEPRIRILVELQRPVVDEETWTTRVWPWVEATFPETDHTPDFGRVSFAPVGGPNYRHVEVPGRPLCWDHLPKIEPAPFEDAGYAGEVQPEPTDEQTDAMVEALLAKLPQHGKRHFAFLGLMGYLAKRGYPRAWVRDLVLELSARTGSKMGTQRQRFVDDTYAKLERGGVVAGLSALEHFAPGAAQAVEAISGSKKRAEEAIYALIRRPKAPDRPHEYRYHPGAFVTPSEKLKALGLSDAVNKLTTHPDWEGVFGRDEFSNRDAAVRPPMRLDMERDSMGASDFDATMVRCWFESIGYKVGKDAAFEVIQAACRAHRFHPIRDYLEQCAQGPRASLDELAQRLGVAPGIETLMVRKAMIGAVARALRPGCKMDSMLVLVGPQGCGKSTAVRVLFGDWARENLPGLDGKDAYAALRGFWGVEVPEFDKVLRTENSTAKAFMTTTVDVYRPAYGRAEVVQPRTCVMWGTCNEEEILRDATGDRRYDVVVTKGVDVAWLREHRDEVWAAAYDAYLVGEAWHLEGEAANVATQHREDFAQRDALEDVIEAWLKVNNKDWVTVADVIRGVVPGRDDMDKRLQARVTDSLRRLKCWRKRRGQTKGWRVPDEVLGTPLASSKTN